MPNGTVNRGKRRASNQLFTDSVRGDEAEEEHGTIASTSGSATPTVKRAKRAETRECPICLEQIPVRLLEQHETLEASRVQTILDHVGDVDGFPDPFPLPHDAPSIVRRRSTLHPSAPASAVPPERLTKTLSALKRRRHVRHMALRAATRDEDDVPPAGKGKARARAAVQQCPVCLRDVEGDPDVVAAHVDACLAHAALTTPPGADAEVNVDGDALLDVDGEGEDEGDPWEESEAPDGARRLRLRPGAGAGAAALGFAVGNRSAEDVEDDIDVEGDDVGAFGAAQFTEADVLAGSAEPNPSAGDFGAARAAAAAEADLAIEHARREKDPRRLIAALESKVQLLMKTPVEGTTGCRICLEAYSEPTVSTGCWHACCRPCWLQCLNATGVCPICKRITMAGDLRRVYL
ncbi:hypothetical protein BC834DRAFT_910779 [Gloeopeniophorella convolvens]|nr:hypothetical protein BC834DRAFT_910779 [Gloeopeniophorella convolvens]